MFLTARYQDKLVYVELSSGDLYAPAETRVCVFEENSGQVREHVCELGELSAFAPETENE